MNAERQTIADALASARARIDRLSPVAARDASADGAILIDTRCQESRDQRGVIPDAIHIPLSVLFWRVDPTSSSADPRVSDPNAQIILFCAHGYSSSMAAATLRDLGFWRATDVDGGFEAWAAAGLPVDRA